MPTATNGIGDILDVAIIGAGLYGFKAAQTYLQLKPDVNLNYPDAPMPKDGVTDNNMVSREMIFEYMDKYADDNDLKRRIRCESWVSSIERCPLGIIRPEGDITILRDNIDYVDSAGATLRSREVVVAQYMIYCTGWGDHFSFFSPELKQELGIPQYGDVILQGNSESDSGWEAHDQLADAVVARKLPLLAAGPKDFEKPDPNRILIQRRWRLYNRCVPISTTNDVDRSVVVLGQIHTTQTPTIAAVQSLWAIAYLLGEVDAPSKEVITREVTEWNGWTRKRYLGVGERYPYALFDWIPYLDRLLHGLGVKCRRKKGMFANLFGPHSPDDYTGVVDEYMAVRKERRENKES
ncbi:flavin-binding monooxygenase-like family protein [Penicillium concentricum]|uniref:Flavin-binding monooxygenase-like family protein n=1 Tax=Penicillium concentricum TaxID=293559 RepID=A0A9W9RCG8_9EURO|nr:flavin-binding monooxygenase-like family protein [Penicillium concentricum]KAJ5356329.1 flavin-binding monooxygenase-like family protein [Penicillium concentricum]